MFVFKPPEEDVLNIFRIGTQIPSNLIAQAGSFGCLKGRKAIKQVF